MSLTTHDRILLINGRIVDVENGCYFSPQVNLVIQNGKILAMPGLAGEPDQITADAVIDLHQLTVIPGLFNTHCHLQFVPKGKANERQIAKNFNDCIDRGITNVRDTLSYDLLENRAWIDKMNKGEVLGPRIHQAIHIGPLGGTYTPRLNPLSRFNFSMLGIKLIDYKLKNCGAVIFPLEASPQQVRDAVNRAVDERGAVAIKLCDQPEHFITFKPGAKVMTFEQLEAAVDQANKRGMPTTMHNVTVKGFRQGIQAGLTSLAHIPIDSELEEADATLLQRSHTYIEPTLTVCYFVSYSIKGNAFEGHPEIQRVDVYRDQSYEGLVKEVWLPEFQALRLGMHTALRKGEFKVFGFINLGQPLSYYSKAIPIGGKNLSLLVNHGTVSRMGCGNDAGPSNCSAASIHHELSLFDFFLNRDETTVFKPIDLLRTATILSARSMAVEDLYGSIQTGKIADLVILEGDPLQNYHLIGKPVKALFMEGKLVVNRCELIVDQSKSP